VSTVLLKLFSTFRGSVISVTYYRYIVTQSSWFFNLIGFFLVKLDQQAAGLPDHPPFTYYGARRPVVTTVWKARASRSPK